MIGPDSQLGYKVLGFMFGEVFWMVLGFLLRFAEILCCLSLLNLDQIGVFKVFGGFGGFVVKYI